MNNIQYSILQVLYNHYPISQRKLAQKTQFSLGLVNKVLQQFIQQQIINENYQIIDEYWQKAFQSVKKRNAIILAAGLGTRLTPLNKEISKAFFEVKEEKLIERLIKQCHEAKIKDITIVVGYRKQQFDYLVDKYQVKLLINRRYRESGSLYSLYLAKQQLQNTFVIPCDIYSEENPFLDIDTRSWYGIVPEKVNQEGYVTLNKKFQLHTATSSGIKTAGGLLYLNKEDSKNLNKALQQSIEQEDVEGFYEDLLFNKDDTMTIQPKYLFNIHEINSYLDLLQVDAQSPNLHNETIRLIEEVFNIDYTEIQNIEVLKAGMTNNSFIFTVKDKRYIMRVPGEATDQLINRQQEKQVYDLVSPAGFSEPVVYMNDKTGYKITQFVEDSHNMNINNKKERQKCLDYLKQFHDAKFQVDHTFDVFERIEYYEELMHHQSMYDDYQQVKDCVMSLQKCINQLDKRWTLCHIDSVCDNFLITPEKVYLIDFEYAGMQDADLDLAMMASYSMVKREMVDEIISNYYHGQVDEKVKFKIYAYMAMVGLLWSNWCEIKHQKGVDFGDYAYRQYRYAKDFYDILVKEAKHHQEFSQLKERKHV